MLMVLGMRAIWSMVVVCLVAGAGICPHAGPGRDQRMTLADRRMPGMLGARTVTQAFASRRAASPGPLTPWDPELPEIVVAAAPAPPGPPGYWIVRVAFDSVAAAVADHATRSARGPPIA